MCRNESGTLTKDETTEGDKMYYYSDPARETDPYALPDCEVFHVTKLECAYNRANLDHGDEYTIVDPGWYWWPCFPGYLPDGDAFGPFESEKKAVEDCTY